jgi:hypothetical protein
MMVGLEENIVNRSDFSNRSDLNFSHLLKKYLLYPIVAIFVSRSPAMQPKNYFH